MAKKPLIIVLRKLHLFEIVFHTKEFFYQLLRVDLIRALVTGIRYFWFVVMLRRMRTLHPDTGDIGVNTVRHNKGRMTGFSELAVTRSNLLVYPLSAIRMSKSAPVLCVGPRTEGELLNMIGLRFKNVRGLDLISYSPWIDLGDMHAMPYKDNSYAAIIIGWVLAYSDNRKKAAAEAIRVAKNGALIAVGVEWRIESSQELGKKMGYELPDEKRLQSTAEILELFAPHVDRVFFSQDLPDSPVNKWELLVIFSVKK